jgi:DnaJ domain
MRSPDWYAVLGVGRTASRAQIAKAFRKLAFRWHPDRNANNQDLAHRHFLLVHQAYEVLHDPVKRLEFDAETAPPAAEPAAPFAPPVRRGEAREAAPWSEVDRRRSFRSVLSRVAWFPLGLLIRLLSFVFLLLVGPFAERLARNELDRKAPALVDYLFPVGRTALVAGIVLLIVQRSWQPLASPVFAIILIGVGVLIFVIERIALASVWAFGRGGRPKR